LDVLSGDEAQIVLKDLLSSRPDLVSDARRAANALLATVSFADVAADVLALYTRSTWTTWSGALPGRVRRLRSGLERD
jgi:hypothetical protein